MAKRKQSARGQTTLYVCPLCDWSLPEPDPSGYPDTEQGQDNLAADYAYFDLEKERHTCRRLARSLPAPHNEYLPF
jgi:hypothetical protein